ncbi:hypothetical protein ACFPER_13100 [Agromyces aurantiacus]|uniref:DUF58 domain-containing protein n=1 Tax=Agromyces aurantiacus TaxID=165814 RepID=A0ABV9RC37_9MICO|nr:hypothetical protein [Agromyces aurantiacus]MBM7504421.1 hypothetical protein [Agromyces aurantiacus]
MSAPRFVSPLHWEPLPYLVLVALLVLTGLIRPESGIGFAVLMAAIALAGAWLIAGLVRERRTRNPDTMGEVDDLEALEVVDAPRAGGELRTVVPVADTHRHQPAIELARLHGGAEQRAVLVPRARRWLSPRYRIGVQLVGEGRPRHAGFLPDAADARWRDGLDELRGAGRFLRVPARIEGSARPYRVDLDLSGLGAVAPESPGR